MCSKVAETAEGAQVVGAVRRYGRKGGRVAVLGSWEVFAEKALATRASANKVFLEWLINWRSEADDGKART